MHATLFMLVPCLSLSVAAASQAAVIYQHNFNGSATSLDDTAPDVAPANVTVSWTAGSGILGDGSVSSSNMSAWLPYTFGSGIYEVKLSLDLTSGTSSGFGAISFTIADPFETAGLSTSNYLTFALRGNRNFVLFTGPGSASPIAGGTLADGLSTAGTLRLVLDTTGSASTVDAYYTPDLPAGSSEITIDLDAGSGTTYTLPSIPTSEFTGVGFINSTSNIAYNQFTFSVVPEPASLSLIGLAMAPLAVRRARRG